MRHTFAMPKFTEYTERTPRSGARLLAAAATLVILAACGGDAPPADDMLATDSTLARDLAMAGQDSAVPELADVPAPAATPAPSTPAPARPRPRPTAATPAAPPAQSPATTTPAAAAAPETGEIAAGTTLRFAAGTKVCSDTQVGERFNATLSSSVTGTNGAVIPSGAMGTFEVTEARRAANQNDETYLRVRLVAVSYGGNTYPVQARTEEAATAKVRAASTGTDAKKVAGGAIVGAIAGRVLGKSTKGAVVGAAAGAAAGTAAAMATADWDTCLQPGAAITVALSNDVVVRLPAE